jgi:hypothetical protein
LDDPSSLRASLSQLAASWGIESPLETARIFSGWEEVVGVELAARCRPTSLKGGVLRVRTHSAVWASELRYLSGAIIERVNRAVGSEIVRELKPWVATGRGAGEPQGRQANTPVAAPEQAMPPAGGNGEDEAFVAGEIQDQPLANALKRAFKAAQNTEKANPPVVYWDNANEASGGPQRPLPGP